MQAQGRLEHGETGASEQGKPAPVPSAKQTRHSDKLMMLAATVARMVVGMLTFIVMARYLGPVNFGVIATAIAYSTFIGIVTDYGLNVSAIRTASAAPDEAQAIVSQAIATKLLLTGVATVVAAIVAVVVLPARQLPIYGLAYAGVITYAFADLAMIAARARRRFEVEATVVVGTSIVMMLIVAGTAFLTRDVLATALAFMGTRVVYLGTTLVALRGALDITIGWLRPLAEIRATLRLSSSYALDSILTTLSSQVDLLVFGVLLSAHDMGIYQAGARLVQVIMPFAVVLSTVYMPVLSAAAIGKDDATFRTNSRKINLEFTALAIVGGLGFAIVGPIFTHLVYGDRYAALAPLWAGFGAFTAVRLASAGLGIQIAALGIMRVRIAAQMLSIATTLILAFTVVRHFGIGKASVVLAISSVPIILLYAACLLQQSRAGKAHNPIISTLMIIGFSTIMIFTA